MKIYNSLYKTYPQIIHAPGKKENFPLWESIQEKTFLDRSEVKINKNITIITWNNNEKIISLLEKCLDFLGLPYLIFGKGIPRKDWVNQKKPRLLLDNFDLIKSELVIGLDSFDVVVLGDMIAVEERFRLHDCEMLYGSELFNSPPVRNYVSTFEDEIAGNYPYRYLNSGTWIGKREFVYEFFHDAFNSGKTDHSRWRKSDQLLIKYIFPKYYPRVKLDYEATIFQNIHGRSQPDFLELI